MNTLDRALSSLFPVAPGPQPIEEQIQEQIEPLLQVVAEPITYAVAIGRIDKAEPVQFKTLVFERSPFVDMPGNEELWGILTTRPDGRRSLAAFMWDNARGYRLFAFKDHSEALATAARLTGQCA